MGLPVVGEDDEVVLARGDPRDDLQLVEDAVDRLQGLEALRAQHPGVVGDLVEVDVVDVDRPRTAEHVLRDQDRVQVPQGAVGDASQQGGRPGALASGLYVAPYGPPRLEPVPRELGDGPGQGPGETAGVHHELGHRTPGRLSGTDPAAHGQRRMLGVPGEQVADAGTPVDEKSATRGQGLLDQCGVLGLVRDQHPVVRAVVPPERGYPVDHTVEDAHLARWCRRRQLRRPLAQRVRAATHPPGQGRHSSGVDGHLDHRERDAVHLHEHDARNVCIGQRDRVPASGADESADERLIGARGAEPADHGADQAHDDGDQQR